MRTRNEAHYDDHFIVNTSCSDGPVLDAGNQFQLNCFSQSQDIAAIYYHHSTSSPLTNDRI